MVPNKRFAVSITIAAVLAIVAALMPWAELTVRSPEFGGMPVTISVSGFNGWVGFGWIRLHNWLAILAAAGVAGLCWLKTLSIWDTSPVVPYVLAGYGLAHTAAFLVMALASKGQASLEIGAILTPAAFVYVLVVLTKHSHSPMTSTPNGSSESAG